MQNRNLFSVLESLALSRNKMVFLSGPRQAGKTTLAKEFLKDKNCYFTWEDIRFRKKWIRSPIDFAESLLSESEPLVVLDEIYKHPKWKNQLKGLYDIYGDKIKIIVTGSALFNTFRKGSDSLMGRFFHSRIDNQLDLVTGEPIGMEGMANWWTRIMQENNMWNKDYDYWQFRKDMIGEK